MPWGFSIVATGVVSDAAPILGRGAVNGSIQASGIQPGEVRAFVGPMFEDVHERRVLSIANATTGVLTSASLAVRMIGQRPAHALGLHKHSSDLELLMVEFDRVIREQHSLVVLFSA